MENIAIPEEKLQELSDLLGEARCYLAPASTNWLLADLVMFAAQKILWEYTPTNTACEENSG